MTTTDLFDDRKIDDNGNNSRSELIKNSRIQDAGADSRNNDLYMA